MARRRGSDPGVPRYGKPIVQQGALVIVGGGGMPQPIVDRFVELAGGSDAHIVVLPTAGSREQARRERVPGFLRNANIASVTMLPDGPRRSGWARISRGDETGDGRLVWRRSLMGALSTPMMEPMPSIYFMRCWDEGA